MLDYQYGRYYLGGKPLFVRGVEYQYYRDRQDNWQDRLQKLRAAHANVVTFYIPWRHHVVASDNQVFDFYGDTQDNRNLVAFIDLCGREDFFIIAKPGPFVHSELNIGGLPDFASPGFNPDISPVLDHEGKPLVWGYDRSILPSPFDASFDALAKEWLQAVGNVLRPHVYPAGRLVGIQLNDETLYCTSNAPPWAIGFENKNMPEPPQLGAIMEDDSDIVRAIKWGDYQWRLRSESYAQYKRYLNIELPHLSNFAGLTPEIVENIPEQEISEEQAKPEHAHLYADWWFSHNRIEADRDVFDYGFISWLGVAAYNIESPTAVTKDDPCNPNQVFNRYVNTVRRAPGINMEENWGFAKLYHPFSRYPIIPFYQTLLSIAAGGTGYVVFCGVQHDYWTDELDKTTKKQHPTFPSDAPLTADGEITPMYRTMDMMNQWFDKEGETLLAANPVSPFTWLIYPPYGSVAGWVPDGEHWAITSHQVPRAGFEAFESFSGELQSQNQLFDLVDLQASSATELRRRSVCFIRLAFFMDDADQNKLINYVEDGGSLVCCGEVPSKTTSMEACDRLARHLSGRQGVVDLGDGRMFYSPGNLFTEHRAIESAQRLGFDSSIRVHGSARFFVHEYADGFFLWCFGFERSAGPHKNIVDFAGHRVEISLGSKTAGVIHMRGGKLHSAMFKGVNEVEDIESSVAIKFGDRELHASGDWLQFF